MKNWNQRSLEKKVEQGHIQSFKISQRKKKKGAMTSVPNRAQLQTSKELEWIKWNLWYWCNQHAVEHSTEYRFDEKRKYRFDFAITALKIAVEYEGLMSDKSGHTTVTGYTKDTDKYNLAQSLGWRVIRLTALNYTNLLRELNNFYERKENSNA